MPETALFLRYWEINEPDKAEIPMGIPTKRSVGRCTYLFLRWMTMAEREAKNACSIEMPAIVFIGKAAKPNSGGIANSSGIMTIAPPTPRNPERKPPIRLRQNNNMIKKIILTFLIFESAAQVSDNRQNGQAEIEGGDEK